MQFELQLFPQVRPVQLTRALLKHLRQNIPSCRVSSGHTPTTPQTLDELSAAPQCQSLEPGHDATDDLPCQAAQPPSLDLFQELCPILDFGHLPGTTCQVCPTTKKERDVKVSFRIPEVEKQRTTTLKVATLRFSVAVLPSRTATTNITLVAPLVRLRGKSNSG